MIRKKNFSIFFEFSPVLSSVPISHISQLLHKKKNIKQETCFFSKKCEKVWKSHFLTDFLNFPMSQKRCVLFYIRQKNDDLHERKRKTLSEAGGGTDQRLVVNMKNEMWCTSEPTFRFLNFRFYDGEVGEKGRRNLWKIWNSESLNSRFFQKKKQGKRGGA